MVGVDVKSQSTMTQRMKRVLSCPLSKLTLEEGTVNVNQVRWATSFLLLSAGLRPADKAHCNVLIRHLLTYIGCFRSLNLI